jgi:tetratricopeptide (TPR) repeat protein
VTGKDTPKSGDTPRPEDSKKPEDKPGSQETLKSEDSPRSEEVRKSEDALKSIEEQLGHDPQNQTLLLDACRLYHRFAMQGDGLAFDNADRSVSSLLAVDKNNVEALAIQGSLHTIRVRKTRSLLRKIYYSIKAARTLDRAVKIDSTNIAARTIRAFTALVLPGFLRRVKTAVRDFEYLIERKREQPELLPDEMMPKVYYNLGLAYAKSGNIEEAMKILAQTMAQFPQTRESTRAQNLLEKII